MGSSTKKTTSTQTSTPAAMDDFRRAMDNNQSLYELLSGRTAPAFTMTNPFSRETEAGLQGIASRAEAGSPLLGQAQGAVGDIASGGVLGGARGYIGDMAAGNVRNEAAQFLTDTASGNFLTGLTENPAYVQGLADLNESVGSIFEGSGRTGSGANQAAVGRGAANLYAGIFNQERANQLNAASSLANIYAGDRNAALNAGSLLDADARTRLGAAGMAPGLAQADYMDAQALLGVGQARDAQAQRELDERIWRENFPYENAIRANDILSRNTMGLGALMGGTQTGETEETMNPGVLNSILGGVLTAGSLAAGGGAGAGVSGLAGIFGGGGGPSAPAGGFNDAWFNPAARPL